MENHDLWVPVAGPEAEGRIELRAGNDRHGRPVLWAFTDEGALRRWTAGPAVALDARDLAAVAIQAGVERLVVNVSGPGGTTVERACLDGWEGVGSRGWTPPPASRAGWASGVESACRELES